MSAIVAVMLIVACAPDLIHCEPVYHWQRTWETVADCRRDRDRITRLVSARYAPDRTVMTKCRLYVDEHGAMPHPTPAGTEGPRIF